MAQFEEKVVDSLEVCCDGNGSDAATGHPKVYLHINQEEGSTTCPYCSRKFVLREK